jgi:adenylylsulfate reductase subunit B
MSIRIQKTECVGCGRCIEACPGNLIKKDAEGKAFIRREKDCWGCTSCLKECKTGAIRFFLGADIGGKGSLLSVTEKGDIRTWKVTDTAGNVQTIEVNKKDANKY